jgi:AcrR family transcriptional regulator
MKEERATEELILQCAEKVFHRSGFDGARMQEIADEAGINKALLHYYFRSKDRLFDAVFSAAVSRLVPPVFSMLNTQKPLTEKIADFVRQYFMTVMEHPFLPGFIIHEMHRNPAHFRTVMAGGRFVKLDRLQQQLQEGIAAGCFREISVEQFMLNLFSLCAFPFAARNAMQAMTGIGDDCYQQILEERRRLIPVWMIGMIENKGGKA